MHLAEKKTVSLSFRQSEYVYDRALEVIPMGASTFSRNPHLFVIGASPLYIDSARGCRVRDVDGNEFIDYSMALSIIFLGYAEPRVSAAAKAAIDDGLIFTLSCPQESILARTIVDLVPCAEMVRFCKNGSDSCEGAVRLARRHTGKLKVMTVGGYHGFHDWYIASTARREGVPPAMAEWVLPHAYNDIDAVERTIRTQAGEIAALIMEPVINIEPRPGFLERIRELTLRHNIVLIFDEMKTGFRLSIGGAQAFFGVVPDLAVFGKALSNGFPLSALVGKRELMRQFEDENCFLSASYATEKASIAAALKTLEILEGEPVLEHVWSMGERLKVGIVERIERHHLTASLKIIGFAPMTHFVISETAGFTVAQIRSFIQQESVRRGVLFVGYNHTSYAHGPADIEYTLDVYDEVFALLSRRLADGMLADRIEGRTISSFGVRGIS